MRRKDELCSVFVEVRIEEQRHKAFEKHRVEAALDFVDE